MRSRTPRPHSRAFTAASRSTRWTRLCTLPFANRKRIPLTHNREELEEQHAISSEIATALTSGAGANAVDDEELEAELADLQQQELDSNMLKTGSVPVHDQVHRLPNVATGERKWSSLEYCKYNTDDPTVKQAEEEDDEDEMLKKLQAEMAL